MKPISHLCAALLILLIISCAGTPRERPETASIPLRISPETSAQTLPEGIVPETPVEAQPEQFIPATPVTAQPERLIPEIPEKVQKLPPDHIMGTGQVPAEKLADFLLQHNPWAEPDFVHNLISYYVEESAMEGVNYDVAFVQMCLETGFLSYGGLVTPDMNNFCGLGSTGILNADNEPEKGIKFPNPRVGVRAHIQHLKAYASTDPLNNELEDPRYRFVRLGSSPTISGLAGAWAADPEYGNKLSAILRRLYGFAF